jgi:hypothetical protein
MTSTVDLVPTDPPQLVLSTSPGNQVIVTLDDDMVSEIHWLTGCWLQSTEAETKAELERCAKNLEAVIKVRLYPQYPNRLKKG